MKVLSFQPTTLTIRKARLGHVQAVQTHKKGMGQLVELCGSRSAYLHDGIKRAMFW